MSPLVIVLIASLTAIAASASAATMWILSTYIDEDGSSDGDTAPVPRPWSME